MAEAEKVNTINAEVEFIKYKIKTFTESHVYKELLPEVDKKLAEMRQAQDSLVMKFFALKVSGAKSEIVAPLETKIYEIAEQLDANEKKIRQKVVALLAEENLSGTISSAVDSGSEPKFSSGSSRPGHIKSKRKEFNDQIDLLSTSCGLDLGNPETEIEFDELAKIYKLKSDADISKLVREAKSWSQSLVSLSKVFREYEELALNFGEDEEELESNQTIFDNAKSRAVYFVKWSGKLNL